MRVVEPDPGWPAEPSSYPRMNQQLQTKAMALLTALLQGASPTERKVGVRLVAGWGAGAGGHCDPLWAYSGCLRWGQII